MAALITDMLIRPATMKDLDPIYALSQKAGIGMTSLPQHLDVLELKLRNAVNSFAGKPALPMEENFLLVIEDSKNKKLVGTCGVVAHVGLTRPFYSYKLSTLVQASADVAVYTLQRVLHMVNDYTGATEVGSLFLLPEYRKDGIGKLLSRCRYLMIGEFSDIFSELVISEIRGVQDKEGNAPFYDNLARHFFKMDFRKADYINATLGSQFIADLMPKYPIYVNLLPQAAQDVIGEPLSASLPALEMLENEGFRYQGYIDVFDGGPTVQCERRQIRTIRKSQKAKIATIKKHVDSDAAYMIASTVLGSFRVCVSGVEKVASGAVNINEQTAALLKLKKGDHVRFSPM